MKKIVSMLLLLFACAVSVQAQESVQGEAQKQEQSQQQVKPQTTMTRAEYVEKYKWIAIAHMKRFGIPASITMAQGILESSAGNSELARKSNNHFGIKCKKNWTGAKVYHDDDAKGECFRAYPSVEASYEDHAKFLDESPRYDSLFAYPSNDYRSWARGLKACGYATAPDYAERLIKIIENMKLYLLDNEGGVATPAEPKPAEPKPATTPAPEKPVATTPAAATPAVEEKKAETPPPAQAQQTENKIYDKATEGALNSAVPSVNSVAVSDEHVNPNNFRVTVNSHKGYGVYRTNHSYYVVAKDKDTFESIGKIFEISPTLLRRFNDVPKGEKLAKGDIIYIERKQTQWFGNEMQYNVKKGETFYSISQKFGIRLASLLKLNKIKSNRNGEYKEVQVGDVIRLQ